MEKHTKQSAQSEFGFFRCLIYIIEWIAVAAFIAALVVVIMEM